MKPQKSSDEQTREHFERAQSETVVLRPGTVVDNFRVRRLLGRGSFGMVYAALDEVLEREVALKLLRGAGSSRSLDLEREGAAMARVNHVNVVPIYGLIEYENQDVIVMEYISGESLEKVLRRGAATPEDAVYWLDGIIAGLAAVHAAGMVHRDVKPGNVLLGAFGEAKLCDFGLVANAAQALGVLEGTPAYCAPEVVLMDEEAPPRAADFYAVGIIAFELLTGRRLFAGQTPSDTLQAHIFTPAPQVSSVDPELGAFDTWVGQLLEKSPERRPQDPSALRHSLAEALRTHRARHHGAPTILIVDSESARARAMAATIRRICPGPRVVVATDGLDAERFLAESTVDLLVVDLAVSGTSGLELCAVANTATHPPSILVTFAVGSAADWKVASRLGASTCLVHPCEEDAIEIALRRALQWCGRMRPVTLFPPPE